MLRYHLQQIDMIILYFEPNTDETAEIQAWYLMTERIHKLLIHVQNKKPSVLPWSAHSAHSVARDFNQQN